MKLFVIEKQINFTLKQAIYVENEQNSIYIFIVIFIDQLIIDTCLLIAPWILINGIL